MKKIARIIISLVLLGVSLTGVLFVVWPSYREFSSLRMQLEARRERIEQGEQVLAKLKAVEAQVQERQEDFAKIEKAVPRDFALPALYDHIQKLGASSGLVLQSIESREQKGSEKELSLFVVQAGLEGSYEGLKQFLNAVQRSSRLLNVGALNIDSSKNDPGILEITLELIAYARP